MLATGSRFTAAVETALLGFNSVSSNYSLSATCYHSSISHAESFTLIPNWKLYEVTIIRLQEVGRTGGQGEEGRQGDSTDEQKPTGRDGNQTDRQKIQQLKS